MAFQYVKIYYGPHESSFTMSHKPQKLTGIRDHLRRLGFRVDLVPVHFVNYCMFEMCKHEIFRCNIKNLIFNMPLKEDPVGQRAVQAVVDASIKFSRARLYLWFWSLIEDQIFRHDKYSPKEFWAFEFDGSDISTDFPTCPNLIKDSEHSIGSKNMD